VPILKAEPFLYPDDLLDPESEHPTDRRWRVFYTKPRQEKAICRELLATETPYFLPVERKRSRKRGRITCSSVPLFVGYVFAYGTEEERVRAVTTNRISRVLDVHSPDQLVYDLRQLHRLIVSGAPLTIESRFASGRRVRVRCGSLAGVEGTVLSRRGGTRLLVAVNFLQQGASVEIEDFLLEPLD
jgi:transcriptional antiterminator RfaH